MATRTRFQEAQVEKFLFWTLKKCFHPEESSWALCGRCHLGVSTRNFQVKIFKNMDNQPRFKYHWQKVKLFLLGHVQCTRVSGRHHKVGFFWNWSYSIFPSYSLPRTILLDPICFSSKLYGFQCRLYMIQSKLNGPNLHDSRNQNLQCKPYTVKLLVTY